MFTGKYATVLRMRVGMEVGFPGDLGDTATSGHDTTRFAPTTNDTMPSPGMCSVV